MYRINLGIIQLEFASALIRVPQDRINYDWLNEDWIEVAQRIEILQLEDSAIITGFDRYSTGSRTEYSIHIIKPQLHSTEQVTSYLLSRHNSPQQTRPGEAINIQKFEWGELISIDWGMFGYAPGGQEFCILPTNCYAISLDFLKLDWSTINILRCDH